MNEQTKKTLSAIGNLPAGEAICSKGTDGWITVPDLTTDDLHQLREYVERVEEMFGAVNEIRFPQIRNSDCDSGDTGLYRLDKGKWTGFGLPKLEYDSAPEAYAALKEQQSDD